MRRGTGCGCLRHKGARCRRPCRINSRCTGGGVASNRGVRRGCRSLHRLRCFLRLGRCGGHRLRRRAFRVPYKYRRWRTLRPPMNVNNEPRRVRQPERRVVAYIADIEHYSHHIAGLPGPDATQKAAIRHRDGLACQFRRQPCTVKVKEDAVWLGHARSLKRHRFAGAACNVNGNSGVAGRGPVAYAGNQG